MAEMIKDSKPEGNLTPFPIVLFFMKLDPIREIGGSLLLIIGCLFENKRSKDSLKKIP